MVKTANIAVAAAIALAMISSAFAATKNHRNAPAPAKVTISALSANASGIVSPGVIKPSGAMLIQDRGYSASISDPYCGGRC